MGGVLNHSSLLVGICCGALGSRAIQMGSMFKDTFETMAKKLYTCM